MEIKTENVEKVAENVSIFTNYRLQNPSKLKYQE
jgi:hypothetical protein